MDEAISRLSGPGVDLVQALAWLGERAKKENFSLTDVWGILTSAGIMKQVPVKGHKCVNALHSPILQCNMHCHSNGMWSIVYIVSHQMDTRHLSDEANRNASNPYPIYCALEKHCFTHGPIEGTRIHAQVNTKTFGTHSSVTGVQTCATCKIHSHVPLGKWFEMSPHEAGFTELGLFLETSLLGSKFQGGELLEKKPEMDMIELQGAC